MEKRNWIWILSAALLILFTVAFITVYHLVLEDGDVPTVPTASGTEEATSDDVHHLAHPELLTNISEVSLHAFTLNGFRYVKGEDGNFYAEQYPDWPLDQTVLSAMAVAFTQISSTYLVEKSNGSVAYGFYTYDEPTFTIENEIGEKIDLWIGNKCDLDDRFYAASSFADGIYLVSFDKDLLDCEPYDLLILDSFYFFDPDQFGALTLKDGTGKAVYSIPGENADPLDIWSFLGNLGISPSAVQAYHPSGEQLKEWGLDAENRLTAKITFFDHMGEEKAFECRLGYVTEDTVSKQKMLYIQLDKIVYQTYMSNEAAAVLSLLRAK